MPKNLDPAVTILLLVVLALLACSFGALCHRTGWRLGGHGRHRGGAHTGVLSRAYSDSHDMLRRTHNAGVGGSIVDRAAALVIPQRRIHLGAG